jgi:hypothetical protein
MSLPTLSPLRPASGPLPVLAAALLIAGALLSAPPAWTAPAAGPGSSPAAPQFKEGDACPIPGRITAADGSLSGFVPAHHFYLEIDGKEAPAELYNIGHTALLIISPRLPSPVVLKALTVAAVPLAKIAKKPDGTVDVRRDAGALQTLGPVEATNDTASFDLDGHHQVLRLRPRLDFLREPAGTSPHDSR